MGINRGEGGSFPQKLQWGTLMHVSPADFVMFQKYEPPGCSHYHAFVPIHATPCGRFN